MDGKNSTQASQKKILFSLAISLFLFILTPATNASASYSVPEVPGESNLPRCDRQTCDSTAGSCLADSVMSCTEGKKKCADGAWVDTDPETPILNLCYSSSRVDLSYEQNKAIQNTYEKSGQPSFEALMKRAYNLVVYATVDYSVSATESISNAAITMITTPPANTQMYLAHLRQNLGFAEPVYAQGIGFTALDPILRLWTLFRNVAYLFFVLIFAIISLMIILRKRIDPRTVVTIQDSLPRIVIALLLVTFSYAIGGFVIDLGQLSANVVGNIFRVNKLIACPNANAGNPDAKCIYNPNKPSDPKNLESQNILQRLLTNNIFVLVEPLRDTKTLANSLAGVSGIRIPGFGISVRLVFSVAVFFIMFKIFFALLGPYVTVVLSIIFAPLQIVLSALPGNSQAFTGWLKNLIANVAVFPVTFTLLSLAAIFKSNETLHFPRGITAPWRTNPNMDNAFSVFWAPPGLGSWGNVAGELISFGILFIIPKVADLVKQMFEIKPTPLTGIASEELKGAARHLPIIGGLVG